VAEREDGDIGNLVELPTIVPPGRVFEGGLRTGAALPYVERQMEEVTVDDLTSMNRESVAGLTIDEQRVVVVKVSLPVLPASGDQVSGDADFP
jgi:hypothetical protein